MEQWLNSLLCLDATLPRRSHMNAQGCPHPSQCQLLYVNRDTLFSFHPVSEKFLHQMMALYVASHYKNSPNDLQLMSDAPAHQLFVLVPPVDDNSNRLPEPLCVIQVALEGQISRQSVLNSLSRGHRAGGDLIPWLVSQQFQDENFAGLSGARIVRIATNPDYINMGYGTRALALLTDFFDGKFANLSEGEVEEGGAGQINDQAVVRVTDEELARTTLLDEDDVKIKDIRDMPPLFSKLSERRPDQLDYVGVSYGLTAALLKFWKRASFLPVYLRQTPNELTGEHSCVMLRGFRPSFELTDDRSWLGLFARDFHRRFLSLLSYQFRNFPAILSLSIVEATSPALNEQPKTDIVLSSSFSSSSGSRLNKSELDQLMSPFDLKRLDAYANNMLDYHVVLDLIPAIATAYFESRLKPAVRLSGVQAAILLAVGLQRKTLDDLALELALLASQILAMFVKIVRKISAFFRSLVEGAIAETMPPRPENGGLRDVDADGDDVAMDIGDGGDGVGAGQRQMGMVPLEKSLEDELAEGADEAMTALREKQKELINALPLEQ